MRDEDATTAAVRRVQKQLRGLTRVTLDRHVLLWLHVRAFRAFGTERFVDALGAVNFTSLRHYQEKCVRVTLAVWASGFHAFTNAYGRNGVHTEFYAERRHWALTDEATAEQLHLEYLRGL